MAFRTAKTLLLAASAAILSTGVLATSYKSHKVFEVTGNTLTEMCVDNNGFNHGVCLGFVNGAAALQNEACIPEGVKFGQLKAVIVRYMKENPEQLHKPAIQLIKGALNQAWPCK